MKDKIINFLSDKEIEYTLIEHVSDAFTCNCVAKERDMKLSQIVKCMITKDTKNEIFVLMLPGDRKLKIKKIEKILGGNRIKLMEKSEIEDELNLIFGAITPIQLIDKTNHFYMDKTIFDEEIVDISAGVLNAGIKLKTEDLEKILNAKRCDMAVKIN